MNLLITFIISGLWHGANWTFVIWGLYNGVLLVAESIAAKWWLGRGPLLAAVRRAVTLVLAGIGRLPAAVKRNHRQPGDGRRPGVPIRGRRPAAQDTVVC